MDNVENSIYEILEVNEDVAAQGEEKFFNRVKTTLQKITRWKKIRSRFLKSKINRKADKYMKNINSRNVGVRARDLSNLISKYNLEILNFEETEEIVESRTIKLREEMLNGTRENLRQLIEDSYRTQDSFNEMDEAEKAEFDEQRKNRREELGRTPEETPVPEPTPEPAEENKEYIEVDPIQQSSEVKYVDEDMKAILRKMIKDGKLDEERMKNLGIGPNFEIIDSDRYNSLGTKIGDTCNSAAALGRQRAEEHMKAMEEKQKEVASTEENNDVYQEFKEEQEAEKENTEEEPVEDKQEEEKPEAEEDVQVEETEQEETRVMSEEEKEELLSRIDDLLKDTPETKEDEVDITKDIDDILAENNREFERIREESEERKNQILREIEETSARAQERIAEMGDRILEKYKDKEEQTQVSFEVGGTGDFSVNESYGEQIRRMLDAEQANEDYAREIEAKEAQKARQEEINRQKEEELQRVIYDRTARAQEESSRLRQRNDEIERQLNDEVAKEDALDNLIGEVGGRTK